MFEMMYDILGGERDLPYRMTSGRALKLNSSQLIIACDFKDNFKYTIFRMTCYYDTNNQKGANIWLAWINVYIRFAWFEQFG